MPDFRFVQTVIALTAVIGLFTCQPVLEAQNNNKPSPSHADIPYGDHERQVFDLWINDSGNGKPSPLAIYIHGGGFRGGNKNTINADSIRQFQQAGISVAAIHYRLSDTGPYPIMMQDAARCLQTIRSRAGEWNIDPDRIACYGGSAGAGISLWLAFHDDLADPRSSDPIARQSTRILAAATRNGQSTYDLRLYGQWFGLEEYEMHPAFYPLYDCQSDAEFDSLRAISLMEDASALTHLSEDDPPVFMFYTRGNVPVGPKTNPGVWVHHVLLGLKLKVRMAQMSLECVVQSPDHPDNQYGSIEAFLISKLTDHR